MQTTCLHLLSALIMDQRRQRIFLQTTFLLLARILKPSEGMMPPIDPAVFPTDVAVKAACDVSIGLVDPKYTIFNVLDFGAKGDGVTDCTMAFIRGFKAGCNCRGAAMVLIPPGVFLTGPVLWQGPCFNTIPLVINVQGDVKSKADIAMFTGGAEDSVEWITIQRIDGLIITGKGTFDAQGPASWRKSDESCETHNECTRLPASIQLNRVVNAVIMGIKSVDAKGFHIFISNSQNIGIYNTTVIAPDLSPNTDGIHLSKSSNIRIIDSVIGTGDDCISMIQGCINVTIMRVTCGPGHGISIGSLGHYDNELDVSTITVKNCTLRGTDNGLRIKTYRDCDISRAFGIVYQDIIMDRVKNPILIDQCYGNKKSPRESQVTIGDVKFINVVGTTISAAAVSLQCSGDVPCREICMTNVNMQYVGRMPSDGPYASNCTNAKILYSGPQNPPPCKC